MCVALLVVIAFVVIAQDGRVTASGSFQVGESQLGRTGDLEIHFRTRPADRWLGDC